MLQEEVQALSGKRVSDTNESSTGQPPTYELVRYPSGQLNIIKCTEGSSFRDVVGAFTNEADAQKALDQLVPN